MWHSVSDTGLTRKLNHSGYYRQSIEKLHRKLAALPGGKLYEKQPEGYHFSQAFFERRRLALALTHAVAKGEYRFSPARLFDVVIGGKIRTVCSFSMLDRVVHGAVYDMLAPDMSQTVSPHVYSYIKGRNRQQALLAMGRYLQDHRRARLNPKERGLYVLRSDIESYGISIPVHASSVLWRQVEEACLRAYGRPSSPGEMKLLDALIRPVLAHPEGGLYQRLFGLPDGSAVTVWLLNLYAAPLDEALGSVEGGFYARYGDDFVFMHPDRAVFEDAFDRMDKVLNKLSLQRSVKKTRRLFFNGAGRGAEGFAGTTHVEYLGFKVAFDGRLSLKTDRTRKLLRDLKVRAHATACVTTDLSPDERGRLICRVLSDAVDPQAYRPHAYAALLRHLVDDRRYLKQMDYFLARLAVRATVGDVSAKGFRRIPYRRLRSWGLRSLEYARNR